MIRVRRSTVRPAPSAVARRRGIRLCVAGAAVLGLGGLGLAPAQASARHVVPSDATAVTDWNSLTMKLLAADTTKVAQEVYLYTAFVDAAMYDAVVGVDGGYQPYLLHRRAPRHTSDVAAAVTAAHDVLRTYVPSQSATIDAAYAASLAAVSDGAAKEQGIVYGRLAAEALVASRVGDGRNAPVTFTRPPAPGVWRPTPPPLLPMAVPWMGAVRPMMLRSGAQFGEPGAPPALTSARYSRDFAEVKAYGSATSTVRTADQTATALFFSGSAYVQYMNALLDQVQQRHQDLVEAARMFAGVDMAVSDALVSIWHAKYLYGFWRPVTAIREADTDGNPATTADPAWTPLAVTPPYPEYVSGYGGVTGAFTVALAEVLGVRDLRLTLMSTATPGVVRTYSSGRALRADVVDARVWLGFHFRTSDTRGTAMGAAVAHWTLARYLRPLRD